MDQLFTTTITRTKRDRYERVFTPEQLAAAVKRAGYIGTSIEPGAVIVEQWANSNTAFIWECETTDTETSGEG